MTTLVGSILYHNDPFIDIDREVLHKERLSELLKKIYNLSEKMNISLAVDVEIPVLRMAQEILDVVSTSIKLPLWISSFNPELRLEATRLAIDLDLKDRIYYSTLNYMSNDEEFEKVSNMDVGVVIQVFNPRNPLPEGYVEKAQELLKKADYFSINENRIILLTTIDIGSIPLAIIAASQLRNMYKFPLCIPISGPITKKFKEISRNVRKSLLSATLSYVMEDFDIIHFGSLKKFSTIAKVYKLLELYQSRLKKYR
ncbi:hypothetical protein B6U74_04340 [Candidatus Bathyarchaeota archaeon ex4484_205]|nr:MAG: hypothetical protein B6U74_04340 [Candidatus Bathyarchaeota archaeon ex4484_205]RLG69109.1 MAG: hypothetical protein DRN93_01005 [archaeon]HDN17622.1 hypothetical protein [Candidatus Bathyarchaeota archaeon]